MSEEIETVEESIETNTGVWFYVSKFLLQNYNIEDIGTNQFVLTEWLKTNNAGKVDIYDCFIQGSIIKIPKDKLNTLRIIGIRLFGTNNYGTFYLNHAMVLNIRITGGTQERDRLLYLINQCSYNQYKFYKDGYICNTDRVNDKGSKLYSIILEKGVKDTDTLIQVLLIPNGYFNLDLDLPEAQRYINKKGGGTTYSQNKDRGVIYVAVTGENGLSNDRVTWDVAPEIVLMHELAGHAIPQGLEGLDNLNAMEIENKIRSELKITTMRKVINHVVR